MGIPLQEEIARIEEDLVNLLLSLVRRRVQIITSVLLGADIWQTGAGLNNSKTLLTGSIYSDLKKLGTERADLRRNIAVFLDDHNPGAWDDSISVVTPTDTVFRTQLSGDPVDFVPILGTLVDGLKSFLSLDDDGEFLQFVGEPAEESRQFSDVLVAGTTVFEYTLTSALSEKPPIDTTFRVNRRDGAPINYWGTVVMKGLERNEVVPLRWHTPADDVFLFDFAAFTGFLGGLDTTTDTPLVDGVIQQSTTSNPRLNPYFPFTNPNHPEEQQVYIDTGVYKGRQQQQDHRWNFDSRSHDEPTGDGSTSNPFAVVTFDIDPMATDIQTMLDKFASGHNPAAFPPFGSGWTSSGVRPNALPEEHGAALPNLINQLSNIIAKGLETVILPEDGGETLIADLTALNTILQSYNATRGRIYWVDFDFFFVKFRGYTGATWESGGLTRANIEAALNTARPALATRIAQIGTYIGTVETEGSRAKALYDAVDFAVNLNDGWLRDMLQKYISYDRGLVIISDFLERRNKLQSLTPVERTFSETIILTETTNVFVNDSFITFRSISDSLDVFDTVDIFKSFVQFRDSLQMFDSATPVLAERTLADSIILNDLLGEAVTIHTRIPRDSIAVHDTAIPTFIKRTFQDSIVVVDIAFPANRRDNFNLTDNFIKD